jgi:hypothetical protein
MDVQTARTAIKILAGLYLFSAVLAVIGGILLLGGSSLAGAVEWGNQTFATIGRGLAIGLAIVLFALAALDLAVGLGLLSHARWARVLALVIGTLNLFSFPIGTIIGLITIWLLGFDEGVKALFEPVVVEKVHKARRS